MATKTETTAADNTIEARAAAVAAAIERLSMAAAEGGAVTKDNVRELVATLTELQASLKAIRDAHMKLIRNTQSEESRSRQKARVAKALALLAAQEAAEANAGE
ncbi:hypothetical protein [Leifsonia sp. NCR5]|uniref:hypothetical protein n=1 Tax=Leifsonia sp. NCR5 TaxID=1978342 RepID=UPI000A199ACE|nr:hypothetical protein [Leifsonia sp. NCR5]